MTRYARAQTFDAIVIYDAKCAFCSAATEALKRVDSLGAVEWDADAAQSFLEAQFGTVPYAVVLVDLEVERVSVGRTAAKELARRAGLPGLVADLAEREFDRIEMVVDKLGSRAREPDELQGTFDLADNAPIEALAYAAWTLPTR